MKIFKSFYSDAVISQTPIGTRILQQLGTFGDRIALIDGETGREFTFAEIKNDVIELAKSLWGLGVRKGDVVMLAIPLKPEYSALLVAISLCGAVINFSTFHENKEEVLSYIDILNPVLIVTDQPKFNELNLECQVFSLEKIHDLQSTLDPLKRVFPTGVAINVHEDPFAIFNSSGTTGKSKGIVSTHYGGNAAIDMFSPAAMDRRDCGMVSLPRFHAAAVCMINSHIDRGIKMILTSNVSSEKFYSLVQKHNIAYMFTTDAIMLMDVINNATKENLKSVKYVTFAGMPFPPHMLEKAKNELGITITSAYGSSEAGGISISFSATCPRNSVGMLFSNVKVCIVDPVSGKSLDVNQPGEIWVKSPCMMKEYFKPSEEDKLVKDAAGWLHTGDVGYFDEYEYLYIIDRIKNVIKGIGGVSIYPSQMEPILLKHPDVKDVAVVGVKDPKYSETPVAYVVTKNDSAKSEEILEFYNEKVADFKKIYREVEFVDVLPRVGLGKVNRVELKKKYQDKYPAKY